jgi:hypothetical protein
MVNAMTIITVTQAHLRCYIPIFVMDDIRLLGIK